MQRKEGTAGHIGNTHKVPDAAMRAAGPNPPGAGRRLSRYGVTLPHRIPDMVSVGFLVSLGRRHARLTD